jgi:hypothetical protein
MNLFSLPSRPYRLIRLVTALTLIVGIASTAHADWKPSVDLLDGGDSAILLINKKVAIKFENINASPLLAQRPTLVMNRLTNLVQRGFNPKFIVVKDSPQGAVIIAGGNPLLTVTDAEARAKGMTRKSLAVTWANRLKELLLQEPLNASPEQTSIPFGETRVVRIGGAITGEIHIALDPTGIVDATVDQDAKRITLNSKATGSGTLTIAVGDQSIAVPFAVRKYAGHVQDSFVSITGSGPDRQTLRRVVEDQVEKSVIPEPGAVAQVDDGAFQLPKSISEQGTVLSVPVKIAGEDYLPVATYAKVRLIREEVGRAEPNLLFYSNDPEMLRKYYGVLYNGVIRSNQAVRLLYHHQSAMDSPIRFVIQLKNGPNPARIQIIDGAATPQVDTYQIGGRAAAKFFPQWLSDSGYVLNLQPEETVTLLNQRLNKDVTTSGIYHFVLLAGSQVTVQVRADPMDVDSDVRETRPNPEVYPTTRKRITETYTVGGRWAFIPFGRDPVKTKDHTHPLDGDYGVIYDMTLNLENPTEQQNSADVVFDPAAGVARGVFIVDGKLIETSHLQPPQEFVLGSYPLAPGEKRQVHILTMPLAGSNYPARFAVRPRYTIAKKAE